MRSHTRSWISLAVAFSCLVGWMAATTPAAQAVTVDWVTVGDPGNAADTEVMGTDGTTGYGPVAYVYRIGKYEVTNAQYTEFLNAVAATDTYDLYNADMGSGYGGIARDCSSGPCTYSTIAGRGDMPVNYVSFWDTLRFANWLHNGQPEGAQGNGTTETGAYTITADGITNNTITRNADAIIFLTSEDEWYKAAYYDALSTSYFDYPAGSDAWMGCALPSGDTGNSANCSSVVGDLTDVGAYSLSGSPYGTFDQGGNIWEWNEAIIGSERGARGGSFNFPTGPAALARDKAPPTFEVSYVGFRVAMIPEPGTGLLVMAGIFGLAAWRRRSA